MRRPAAAALVLAALVGGLACGGGDDGASLADEPVPDDPDVVIVAQDMAFDPDEVQVAADRPVSIVLDNRDEGVNHNLHVKDAPAPNETPLEQGMSRQGLTVTLPAGEYEFVCDIHPNMDGTLVAR